MIQCRHFTLKRQSMTVDQGQRTSYVPRRKFLAMGATAMGLSAVDILLWTDGFVPGPILASADSNGTVRWLQRGGKL